MKHDNFKSNLPTDLPDDVRKTIKKRSGRRSRLTKKQAAYAATYNLTTDRASPDVVNPIALDFIADGTPEAWERLGENIGRIREENIREHFTFEVYRPHPAMLHTIDNQSYIDRLLSPSASTDILEALDDVFPGHLRSEHPAALDALQKRSNECEDTVYQQVMAGNFPALLSALRNGTITNHDPVELTEVIRNHARCFAIRTAHLDTDVIRQHSRAPEGDFFAGFKDWAKVGSTILATKASPANIIQQFTALYASQELADTPVEDLPGELIRRGLLPEGPVAEMIINDFARAIFDLLASQPGGIDDNYLSTCFAQISPVIAPLAAITPDVISEKGLAQMDFCALRTGLDASEATAFVAFQVRRAFAHIDLCIAAAADGNGVPLCPTVEINKKDLAFVTALLRAEGEPDQNAHSIGRSKTGGEREFDKVTGGSLGPTRSMLEKIADPSIAERASLNFGFDASAWFAD